MSLFPNLYSNFDFFHIATGLFLRAKIENVPGRGGGGVQTLTKIAKILHVHIFSQGAYVKNWPACNDKKKFFLKHPTVHLVFFSKSDHKILTYGHFNIIAQ